MLSERFSRIVARRWRHRMLRCARTVRCHLLSLAAAVLASACVTPATQVGTVSRADVDAEVVKQQQLFIQSSFEQQQRLSNVAAPLLRAAVPLCGGAVTTRMGVHTMNRPSFTSEYQEAARTLGFGDTLEIV